jgi:hypothetical protein
VVRPARCRPLTNETGDPAGTHRSTADVLELHVQVDSPSGDRQRDNGLRYPVNRGDPAGPHPAHFSGGYGALLTEPSYTAAATAVRAEIERLPTDDEVIDRIT